MDVALDLVVQIFARLVAQAGLADVALDLVVVALRRLVVFGATAR